MNHSRTKNRYGFLLQTHFEASWRRGTMGLAWLILFAAAPGFLWAQTEAAPREFPDSLFPNSETFGSIEFGYRWTAGLRGNRDMYRSIVNLGQGPKLFNLNLNLSSPQGTNRMVDRFSLNASNWGGDPYNTVKLFAEKYEAYRLTFNYQNVNYFNSVPSFANPKLANGILIGQHSYDTTRRASDIELILFPTAKISPFVGYSRSSGAGPGITTFTGDQNEYLVNTRYGDSTDTYRGGVTLSLPKFSLILEQKLLKFRDDQRIYQTQPNNPGNRSTPVFGRSLDLDSLEENYHFRGTSPVTVAQMSAFPWDKLTISGRFVFSQPDLSSEYDRRYTGNAISFDVLRFYTGENVRGSAEAERPHTTGDLAIEFHPFSRLSILNSLYLDRFHAASSSSLGRTLTGTTPLAGVPDPGNQLTVSAQSTDQFAVNINQNQIEGVVTLAPSLSLRGGYRYAWSDARLSDLEAGGSSNRVKLHRNVALAGLRFKLHRKVTASLDFESGKSSGIFNRKNQFDFTKLRARGRYQPMEPLILTASVTMLDNSNPQTDIKYSFRNRGYTFSAAFAPAGGQRFSLSVDYSRSDLDSDLIYIIPQLFTGATSVYRDNSHSAGLYLDLGLFRGARLNMGYGIISTTGTHPVIYHQPRASLDVPITNMFSWVNEWRYYDLNDKLYRYEKFHNNLIAS